MRDRAYGELAQAEAGDVPEPGLELAKTVGERFDVLCR
jgi:hypothetical protein